MRVGIATDHAGFRLKGELMKVLANAGYELVNFGNHELVPDDDYPSFVVPLARAVARGEVQRGIAVCGSGVGAAVVANKIRGVRASLIHDVFSAHQGVEDDDMNVICLGGHVIGDRLAFELAQSFLQASFRGAERHLRRLAEIAKLEPNPLKALQSFGQSVWMDFIRRGTVTSGELARWVAEDGVGGVTSNPSIFEKAIVDSHDYDEAVRSLALEGKNPSQIFEALAVEDIRRAADVFRPTYDRLEGRDGFVSIEVSPHLAHDTEGSVAEARRLWSEVNRPNVMIKIPATREGLPAIERLIAEGINVNITLLFGLPRYERVAEAYLAGLEKRVAAGQPIDRIASVASFFLSRIDVLLDPRLEKAGPGTRLRGEAAIASAKVAYQIYKRIVGTERFRRLASKGARVQRLLWASTSTKNPAYSDVKYVEPLIGPDTINTVPLETFEAYRDHGSPALRLEEGAEQARQTLRQLVEVGIDLDQATQQLEDEGVAKFIKPYDKLLATLEQRRRAARDEPVARRK